jgi:glucosamine-6-phosphate deaminase
MKVFVSSRELIFKSIAGQIAEALEKKPAGIIALPTGATPLGLYKELVEKFEQGKIDFSKAVFINLDEYAGLPQSHAQSYARFLRKNFLDKVNASEKNIFLFNGKAIDLKKEAAQREAFLKKKGIDIALLGIGKNCHIAFNEPGSGFNSITRIVNLDASTRQANARFFKNKARVPKQAITMGLATIMKAKKIILMAIGKKKALAIKKMLGKPSEKAPASILQKHKNVEIYCNEEAGFLLENALSIEYNNTAIFSEKNLPKKKRIIFISPHPDDSAIAAGATLSMLANHNNVFVFVMTSGHRAVKNNQTKEQKTATRQRESNA